MSNDISRETTHLQECVPRWMSPRIRERNHRRIDGRAAWTSLSSPSRPPAAFGRPRPLAAPSTIPNTLPARYSNSLLSIRRKYTWRKLYGWNCRPCGKRKWDASKQVRLPVCTKIITQRFVFMFIKFRVSTNLRKVKIVCYIISFKITNPKPCCPYQKYLVRVEAHQQAEHHHVAKDR